MPWIPDSRYCSPDSNPKLYSGFPELYSGIQSPEIPDSTAKFPGFRNQSTSENFPESGILIPLHGANTSPGLPAEWSMQSVSLLASLIVNRSPLSVKRIPGFVFAFKTNARHSILCLDYIKVFANLGEAGDRLHNCCFCSGKVMLHGTIRNDDF